MKPLEDMTELECEEELRRRGWEYFEVAKPISLHRSWCKPDRSQVLASNMWWMMDLAFDRHALLKARMHDGGKPPKSGTLKLNDLREWDE